MQWEGGALCSRGSTENGPLLVKPGDIKWLYQGIAIMALPATDDLMHKHGLCIP